jgi:hypothetical protein
MMGERKPRRYTPSPSWLIAKGYVILGFEQDTDGGDSVISEDDTLAMAF